jgi:hypothetical protein
MIEQRMDRMVKSYSPRFVRGIPELEASSGLFLIPVMQGWDGGDTSPDR